jgi:hypothetical protein
MTDQIKIGKIKVLFLFISLPLPYSANADNSKLNDSDYKEISDSSIKEFTNDSLFIVYRGTLPETIDQKWEKSIVNCWLNLTKIGPSYSEFDSSVKSVASNNEVIIIDLNPAYKEEINEKIAGNKTTNKTPGFTSLMVVLGLLSLLIIKRS